MIDKPCTCFEIKLVFFGLVSSKDYYERPRGMICKTLCGQEVGGCMGVYGNRDRRPEDP